MKKILIAFIGASLVAASLTSCSSSKGASGSVGQEAKALAKEEAEQLTITYLKQRLASGHPALASLLNTANASTPLSTILANGANTSTLTSLVSSQFGINQSSVASTLSSKGGTVGTLAAFIVQNTNASTLATLLKK